VDVRQAAGRSCAALGRAGAPHRRQYHCLWSLGFNPGDGGGRVFWHSLFGCAFFGAFATKVLAVRSHRMPGWALPVVGGLLFTVLVLLWLTSSLWFFQNIGVEF
jgi:hypothetical protein